jgi:hypothetical protein
LERQIDHATMSEARPAQAALNMNARRRPMRCISRAPGSVVSARPMIDIDTGNVASEGSGASRAPRMPPNTTMTTVPEADKACASASR